MTRPMMTRPFRNVLVPMLAALAIGAASPVLAADYIVGPAAPPMVGQNGPVTLQQALAVASDIGVVTVSNTHFDDDQWEIEGRDIRGKWIQVDVDAATGEVRHVDRSIL